MAISICPAELKNIFHCAHVWHTRCVQFNSVQYFSLLWMQWCRWVKSWKKVASSVAECRAGCSSVQLLGVAPGGRRRREVRRAAVSVQPPRGHHLHQNNLQGVATSTRTTSKESPPATPPPKPFKDILTQPDLCPLGSDSTLHWGNNQSNEKYQDFKWDVVNINWEDFIEKRYFERSFHLCKLASPFSHNIVLESTLEGGQNILLVVGGCKILEHNQDSDEDLKRSGSKIWKLTGERKSEEGGMGSKYRDWWIPQGASQKAPR